MGYFSKNAAGVWKINVYQDFQENRPKIAERWCPHIPVKCMFESAMHKPEQRYFLSINHKANAFEVSLRQQRR
jgi:hypothetical protein